TGLETVLGLSNKIKLGQIDSAIAGGVDSASDAPIAVSEGLRQVLLDLNRTKTLPQRLQVLSRLRPKDLIPDAPNTGEPRTGLSMGEH
ncbi:acetyl-CoA acetyltransferase, partial [Massilia sp. JS1662]